MWETWHCFIPLSQCAGNLTHTDTSDPWDPQLALSQAPVQDPDDTDKNLESAITKDMDIKINYRYIAVQLRKNASMDNNDIMLEQLAHAAKNDK